MAKVINLTHQRLLEMLDYDPASGIFCWKVRSSNRIQIGDRAGVIATNGYRFITVEREKLQASRLAWFYIHKEWPKGDITFKDGVTDNCAIANLRDVSRIDSARERGLVANNSTGFKGVSPAPFGKFQSKITWNYKQISLGGNFATAEDAAAAYVDAETRLKAATSISAVTATLLLEKRQRAAWSNLISQGILVGWPSFEAFAADVTDVPDRRYAMSTIDAAQPIGPGNYRWFSESDLPTGTAEGRKVHREANRDRTRDKDFRKKYGIDFATYQRMLIIQKGVCAICEQPETKLQNGAIRMLSVDHNHTTGAVRGLLCGNCNMAIGYAYDDVTVLRKAIAYLQRHEAADNIVRFEPRMIGGIMGAGT